MRPQKKWEELQPRTQGLLARRGDPRVPEGFTVNSVGRPKGTPQTIEARRRISAARTGAEDFIAKKTARAIKDLIDVFGTREAIIEELQRG